MSIDFQILDMLRFVFRRFWGRGCSEECNYVLLFVDERFRLQWWEQMHRCELWAQRSFQVNCNETLFKTIHSLNGIFRFVCEFWLSFSFSISFMFDAFVYFSILQVEAVDIYLQANQDERFSLRSDI